MSIKNSLFALGCFALAACGDVTSTGPANVQTGIESAALPKRSMSLNLVHEATYDDRAMEQAMSKDITPPGTKVLQNTYRGTYMLVVERTRIDQHCLADIRADEHPENLRPILKFRFNNECAELFGKLTSENIGRQFAVVVDEEIVTAPTIRAPIWGGSGFIEGGFETMKEAQDMAASLRQNIQYPE